MLKFTNEELLLLADIFDRETTDTDNVELMKNVIEKWNDTYSSIIEFIGGYKSIVHSKESFEMLRDFVFKEDLSKMPLYINENNENGGYLEWKRVVAMWRLQIGR